MTTPRLMVICLGGLAGAGALVCCDLDEGVEQLQAQPDGEAVEQGGEAAEPAEAEGEAAPVH
jgi:hypothetical protein